MDTTKKGGFMKLHFKTSEVKKLVEHVEACKKFRGMYGDKNSFKPGLLLVGDEGVYLMSNGLPNLTKDKTENNKNFVAYAEESNPEKMEFDDYRHAKEATFGHDDGAEFLDIANFQFIKTTKEQVFTIKITEAKIEISVLAPYEAGTKKR